jgi:methionyl-tRNA formyltransferase
LLSKSDGVIDWNKPCKQIEREVRAYLEWPKSKTVLAGKDVIITSAETSDIELVKGKITIVNNQLLVGCSVGSLQIKKLKPAGKNEMPSSAFIAGYGEHLKKNPYAA